VSNCFTISAGAPGAGGHDVDHVLLGWVLGPEQFGDEQDGREGVVEVVRHAPGEGADALQALSAHHLCLELFARVNIAVETMDDAPSGGQGANTGGDLDRDQLAVGPHDLRLDNANAARGLSAELIEIGGGLVGWVQIGKAAREDFLFRQAEEFARGRVGIENLAGLFIGDEDRVARALEQGREAVVGFAQFLFGQLAFGDVLVDPENAGDSAAFAVKGHFRSTKPDQRTVRGRLGVPHTRVW
jgi:hypothetical protein